MRSKLVVTILCSILSVSFAQAEAAKPDLCKDNGNAALAQNALASLQARLLSLRPDLAMKIASTQIVTCNPKSVYIATWDNKEPHPQFALPDVCGAQLLFIGDAEKEVSEWILTNNNHGLICVDQLRANPFPVFSSGN